MQPDIYVHPLSPAKALHLQRNFQSASAPASRAQVELRCPLPPGAARRTIARLRQLSTEIMRRTAAAVVARGQWPADRPPNGRLVIEMRSVAADRLQVTVTRLCDSPIAVESVEVLLSEIARLWPAALIQREAPAALPTAASLPLSRRGGPVGTPEPQRLQIVQGWLTVQGRMNQEVYASTHGIAASTLRRWMRQLQAEDKL